MLLYKWLEDYSTDLICEGPKQRVSLLENRASRGAGKMAWSSSEAMNSVPSTHMGVGSQSLVTPSAKESDSLF